MPTFEENTRLLAEPFHPADRTEIARPRSISQSSVCVCSLMVDTRQTRVVLYTKTLVPALPHMLTGNSHVVLSLLFLTDRRIWTENGITVATRFRCLEELELLACLP
jgi:hypothetical protein